MNDEKKAKLQLILSMGIFGTIGIFVKYIDMPSSLIAMTRGILGGIFVLLFMLFTKGRGDRQNTKKYLPKLIITGIVMAFNWICLFEAYNYTTVAIATLCYYMQPVFLTLASPAVLGEKLSAKKVICVFIALLGMAFVSGVFGSNGAAATKPIGIILGLVAGVLYTVVVLMNKKMTDMDSYEMTTSELLSAGLIMIPYCFLTGSFEGVQPTTLNLIMLMIVCFGHTGIAYVLYFGSFPKVKAQTVAIFGYIDPIVSIILSALLLKEPFGINCAIGAILILGSTFISEYKPKQS